MPTRDGTMNGVSVVIPVYNSRAGLPELVRRIAEALEGRCGHDIIAVNDCSRDDSLRVLLDLLPRYPHLLVVDLANNSGQENAILAGFPYARREYVVCMDDDLQHDPADIPLLLEALDKGDLDIVFARFIQHGNGFMRRMGTWMNEVMINTVVRKPSDVRLSSFVAMRRYLAEKAAEYCGPYPYLAGQYLCLTQRVGAVDLVQHPSRYRPSNYDWKKLLRVWMSGLVNFSLAPLRFLLWCGIGLLGLAGLVVAGVLVNKFVYGAQVPLGWTSIMVAILTVASFQFCALGLLGEYLGRVLMTTTRYPRHCVRRVYGGAEAGDTVDSKIGTGVS